MADETTEAPPEEVKELTEEEKEAIRKELERHQRYLERAEASLMRKLGRALEPLSLSFLDVQRLIKPVNTSKIPVAAWVHTPSEDYIALRVERCARYSMTILRQIVLHESLHRSGYASSELSRISHECMNITYDILINKVLANTSPKDFFSLIGTVYDAQSASGLVRLALPTSKTKLKYRVKNDADTWKEPPEAFQEKLDALQEVDPRFQDLHDWIWDNQDLPTANALFWKIMAIAKDNDMVEYTQNNPFGGRSNETDPEDGTEDDDPQDRENQGGDDLMPNEAHDQQEEAEDRKGVLGGDKLDPQEDDGTISDALQGFCKDNEKKYSWARGFSHFQEESFAKIYVDKEAVEAEEARQFLLTITAKEQMDAFMQDATSCTDQVMRNLAPIMPTPETLVQIACGVTDITHTYTNWQGGSISKFTIYVDTSPSMDIFRERMIGMIEALDDMLDVKIKTFSTDIQEVSTQDFIAGEYPTGYGTDFDCIIEDALQNKDVREAICIFTDGYSWVTPENQAMWKASEKKLYAAYWVDQSWYRADCFEPPDCLENIATASHVLKIPQKMHCGARKQNKYSSLQPRY